MSQQVQVARTLIPVNRPTLARSDLKSVLECMVQEDLSFGSVVANYEKELAKVLEFEAGLTVSSHTAAYHILFQAIKEYKKQEDGCVLLPANAPVAALDGSKLAGLNVEVIDLAKDSLHIDLSLNHIPENTLAVLLFYPFGIYKDYSEIRSALQEKGIIVLEDISYIAGNEDGHRYVGSDADAAILGLNDDMMMTIGKGAAILTDSKKLNAIMKDLRTHSGSRNYRLRYDYTITDYQAALGIEQLGHLGSVLERRKALGRYYVENLHANQSYYSLLEKNVARDAFTGFPVFFEADTQITMKYFRSLRIATSKIMQPGPLHHLLALPASKYPNAERMYARAVVLPLYPTLKKAALERIVQAVKTFHP